MILERHLRFTERASLSGRYILKRATFIKGHFDVNFKIDLPFLSYVSKKKAIPYYKNLRPISVTVKEVLDNRKVKVYMEYLFGL